jgi:hypothetical protein
MLATRISYIFPDDGNTYLLHFPWCWQHVSPTFSLMLATRISYIFKAVLPTHQPGHTRRIYHRVIRAHLRTFRTVRAIRLWSVRHSRFTISPGGGQEKKRVHWKPCRVGNFLPSVFWFQRSTAVCFSSSHGPLQALYCEPKGSSHECGLPLRSGTLQLSSHWPSAKAESSSG